MRTTRFPSLLEQLRSSFDSRRILDSAWLAALGVSRDEHETILKDLHRYLYETLETLLHAMGQD